MMRFVKIQLPDGSVRVLSESTYNGLCQNMASLAKALEGGEWVYASNGEMEATMKGGGPFWKHLLKTV